MKLNISSKNAAKVSLEQWHALIAVVDEGGYAQAAEAMNKSQSAVSYAIQKLETQLQLKVLTLKGRKSVLTPVGKTLYQRAKHLLDDALLLEDAGQQLASGVEAKVSLAVDTLFPIAKVIKALEQCCQAYPATQFEIFETTLSGASEALLNGTADLAISSIAPPGMLGEPCAEIELTAVAHHQHPLHLLKRDLNWQDLRKHRQLVVRDSAQKENRDSGWLGAEQRLTVSQGDTALSVLKSGLAYSWAPIALLQDELASGLIKPLPLKQGRSRFVALSLIYSDRDYAGPATRLLGQQLLAS